MPAADSTCWPARWPHSRTRSTSLDAFLCLTAVGVLLGLVRRFTGNIAACIGLHAGWVAVIYAVRETSERNPQSHATWLMSDYDGFIGWMVLGWTLAIGWVLWYGGTEERAGEESGPSATRFPDFFTGHQPQQGFQALDGIVELEQRLLVIELDGQQLGESRAHPAGILVFLLHVLVLLRQLVERAPHGGAESRVFRRAAAALARARARPPRPC